MSDDLKCMVFLDLEETVIDNWQDGNLLLANIDCIEEFINGRDKTFGGVVAPGAPLVNMRLGLMSWAVWDAKDKAEFNSRFRPHLEHLLKRKFDDEIVWSMADWSRELCKFSNKLISKDDMFDMFGKVEVLFSLARKHSEFKGNRVFLIDDAVEHFLTQKSLDHQSVVEIRNINTMRKCHAKISINR